MSVPELDTVTAAARRAARELAALDTAAKDARAGADRRGDRVAAPARSSTANALDVAAAAGETPAIVDRLTLTPERVAGLAAAVRDVVALPDPVGTTVRRFELTNGMPAHKLRVPLGVILIVYEARPNVTVDAAALCVKSGNACVLRGSSLAVNSNAVLLDVVREALAAAGLPADAVQALPESREELERFVADPEAADVVIPRGGEALKKMLLERSRIPVLAAAGGNCHVYVDASADAGQGGRDRGQRQGAAPRRLQRGRDAARPRRPRGRPAAAAGRRRWRPRASSCWTARRRGRPSSWT